MKLHRTATRRQFLGSLGTLGAAVAGVSIHRSAAADAGLLAEELKAGAGATARAVRLPGGSSDPDGDSSEDEPDEGEETGEEDGDGTPTGEGPAPESIGFPVLPGGGGVILLNNFGGFSVASGACSHNGIDVFPNDSVTRSLVSCVDGVIEGQRIFAGSQGNAWIIQDEAGVSYRYHHIGEFEPGLEVGSTVRRGDVLGTMGSSGNASSAHLHFEVRLDGSAASAVDPIPLFEVPSEGVSVGAPTGCR